MAESNIVLNVGSGGAQAATFQDSGGRQHEEVVIQTQNGSSDPVSVSAANPLPVVQTGPLLAGSALIGSVGVSGALPTGANTIGAVTQSGAWAVTGNVAAGATDSGNGVKISAVFNSAAPVYTTGQRADLQTDANGNLKVNIAAGANAGGTSSNFSSSFPGSGTAVGASNGTNMVPLLVDGSGNLKINIAAGGVSSDNDNSTFTAGSTAGLPLMGVYNDSVSNATSGNVAVPRITVTRQLLVAPQAAVNGGWSPGNVISAATTNTGTIKTSPGQLGSVIVINNGASWAYVKLFNKASAPTLGTDTPVHTIGVPPGGGASYPVPAGVLFTTGIAYAITGGIALTDATAISANSVAFNYSYM